jgi:hypothetical protein
MGPLGMSDLHVVTGAFGYSGKYIAARLFEAGHRVRTLTNSTHRANPFEGRVDVHPFNFDDPDRLPASLEGARVLYNTYWIRDRRRDWARDLHVSPPGGDDRRSHRRPATDRVGAAVCRLLGGPRGGHAGP